MIDARITVTGNVAAPPVLRETRTGDRWASFRIAHTPRRLDRSTGAWSDLETLWFSVTAWRTTGENVAQSLEKGDRVVVTGRLTTRTYRTDDGQEREALEIDAVSVGLDLSRHAARTQRPAPVSVTRDPGDPEPEGGGGDGPDALDEALATLAEQEEPVPA